MRRRLARIALRSALVITALGGIAFVAAWIAIARGHLVDRAHFAHPDDAITIVDRHGSVLRHARVDGIDRRWVPLREISPALVAAFIAAEDSGFRSHGGVDTHAIARAIVQNVMPGRMRSGASTITQQLVKLVYGRHGLAPWAKSLEAMRAIALERMLSKDEILEQYLNRVPFGDEIVGVARASEEYFGVAPSALTVSQAALLAGIPQAPSVTEPRRHLDRALARRDYVLARMLTSGAIERSTYEAARAERVEIARPSARPYEAPRFVDAALRSRTETLRPAPNGTLATTLDLSLQHEAEALTRGALDRFTARGAVNAAAVVIANGTGEILAYVGAARGDTEGGALDLLTARRQPGSTLKPFVYELFFERGGTAASIVDDVAADAMTGAHGESFEAHDYDRTERGPVRARVALSASLNLAALDVARRVGPDAIARRLRALGFDIDGTGDQYGAAIVLGGADVSALELADAYATLARGGSHVPLSPLGDPIGAEHRVLDAAAARVAWDILGDREARRDAFGDDLTQLAGGEPFALKTGTSSGWRDAWGAVSDATFTVVAWMGDPRGGGMAGVSGFQASAPLAARILGAARSRRVALGIAPVVQPAAQLAEAAVCAHTGLLAGPSCTHVVHETFDARHVPRETCHAHTDDGHVALASRYAAWVERAHPAQYVIRDAEVDTAAAPVVRSPRDGASLLVDASGGETFVPLVAQIGRERVANVRWEVDGVSIASAQWAASPGRHRVVAVAGALRSEPAWVTVRSID